MDPSHADPLDGSSTRRPRAQVEELVVLCDPEGRPTGVSPKVEVHTRDTPVHRAFSCYVVDGAGDLLLTRRALSKVTWPGVWTNSVCGHLLPGESEEDAARRRLRQELGVEVAPDATFETVLPRFSYRATDASGTVENEFCPVLVLNLDQRPEVSPDPTEVMEWRWAPLSRTRGAVAAAPFAFSPWMVAQLEGWAVSP